MTCLCGDNSGTSGNVGNTRINAEDSLPMNSWSTVRLRVEGTNATLFVNDTFYMSVETDTRHPHDDVMVSA